MYSGNEKHKESKTPVPTKVVLKIMAPYLDFGRCLYVDNWYNSVCLAEELLKRATHLVGMLNKKRIENPKTVTEKKLRKG